jgi:hypothetical protein
LTVIDIDCKDGKNGFEVLKEKNLDLPPTPAVKTAHGGTHFYYKYHPEIKTTTNVNSYPGIDIRNDGSYVVAPPSVIDGRIYEWVNPLEMGFQEVPSWLKNGVNHSQQIDSATSVIKDINLIPEKIFEELRKLEREENFIKFVFRFLFNIEPKKCMHCILHPEKHPSASVFFNPKTARFEYKDFHTGKVFDVVDLLLEYFSIPERLRKVFRLAFASFLIKVHAGTDKMDIIKTFELLKKYDCNLGKVYFLIASLNEVNKPFISVRNLAFILNIKNITRANRYLNFLCLVEVVKKSERGLRKAHGYELQTVDLTNLNHLLDRLKALNLEIYNLSQQKALQIFEVEKVKMVYRREANSKSLLKTLSQPELKEFSLNSIAQKVANNEISREKALKILTRIYKNFEPKIISESLDKLIQIYKNTHKIKYTPIL